MVRDAVTQNTRAEKQDPEEFEDVVEGDIGMQESCDMVQFGQGFGCQTACSCCVVEFYAQECS